MGRHGQQPSRRTVGRPGLLIAGIVLLSLAAAILLLGTLWAVLGAIEFGEYANPPPSLGARVRDVLPVALGAIVLAAIPATIGAALLLSRRGRSL